MSKSSNAVVLCTYRYDPLDRIAVCAENGVAQVQRFYLKSRLASEIQGQIQRTFMQHGDLSLAHHQQEPGGRRATLLASDQQRSVLHGLELQAQHSIVYTPYGYSGHSGLDCLPGFNGERRDPVTGHYLLGNGYRAFNPVLMRFNSPDNLSPFAEGGLNAYGYCSGDPINLSDPTGHFNIVGFFFGAIHRMIARWFPAATRLTKSLNRPQIASGAGAFKKTIVTVNESASITTQPAPARVGSDVSSVVTVTGGKIKTAKSQTGAVPTYSAQSGSRAGARGASNTGADRRGSWTISKEKAEFKLDGRNPVDRLAQQEFDRFQNHIHSTGTYPSKASGFAIKKMGGSRAQFGDSALYELDLSLRQRATYTVDNKAKIVRVRSVGVHIRTDGSNNR